MDFKTFLGQQIIAFVRAQFREFDIPDWFPPTLIPLMVYNPAHMCEYHKQGGFVVPPWAEGKLRMLRLLESDN